jgi:hypothetical protein
LLAILSKVLSQEEVTYSVEDLAVLVNQYYPDVRKMLNVCQMSIKGSTLTLDKQTLISSNYIDEVIKLLPKKDHLKILDKL